MTTEKNTPDTHNPNADAGAGTNKVPAKLQVATEPTAQAVISGAEIMSELKEMRKEINAPIEFRALFEEVSKLEPKEAREDGTPKAMRAAARADQNWLERKLVAPIEEFANGLVPTTAKMGLAGWGLWSGGKAVVRGGKAVLHMVRGNPVQAATEATGAFDELSR